MKNAYIVVCFISNIEMVQNCKCFPFFFVFWISDLEIVQNHKYLLHFKKK